MESQHTPKTGTEQLCKDYYESQIFRSNAVFEGRVLLEIIRADQSAKVMNAEIFTRELTALNIELFGMAWFVHNYELCLSKEQREDQADSALCAEIKFTKSYLNEPGNENIWSAVGFYNDNILQTTIAQNFSVDWSIPRDTSSYYLDVKERPFETESEKLIFDSLREHFNNLLMDKECALRLGNRLASVEAWRGGIMIPQRLSSALSQRLGFRPNTEACFLLERVTVGLYKNASNYIDRVVEYGSWELVKGERDRLLQHLGKVAREHIEKQNRSDVS